MLKDLFFMLVMAFSVMAFGYVFIVNAPWYLSIPAFVILWSFLINSTVRVFPRGVWPFRMSQ